MTIYPYNDLPPVVNSRPALVCCPCSSPSFPRKREGGFTLEVQQLSKECLGWGLEVEAFSRGIVVGGGDGIEVLGPEGEEIGFARQGSAQASDGVLDAAFLPGAVGIAEEGLDTEHGCEVIVLGELGPVVESDGLAQFGWQELEPGEESLRGGFGRCVWLYGEEEDPAQALVGGGDGVSTGFEEE